MAAEHPQHVSVARVRSTEASVHGSAPVHGSGAELRSTAVNDRAPSLCIPWPIISPHFQDAIKTRNVGSTWCSNFENAVRNTGVPESSVLGKRDLNSWPGFTQATTKTEVHEVKLAAADADCKRCFDVQSSLVCASWACSCPAWASMINRPVCTADGNGAPLPCNTFFSSARYLEPNRVCTTSQSWLRTKKLWDAFKTVVGSKHDVTVEVPLRSTRRHCNLTLQRQKQRQRRKAHLRVCASARHLVSHLQPQVHAWNTLISSTLSDTKPELFNCCSHEDPSPFRTSTAVVETEGIARYGCIEVHTKTWVFFWIWREEVKKRKGFFQKRCYNGLKEKRTWWRWDDIDRGLRPNRSSHNTIFTAHAIWFFTTLSGGFNQAFFFFLKGDKKTSASR